MSARRLSRLTFSLAAVASLGVAACSSDDSGTDAATSEETGAAGTAATGGSDSSVPDVTTGPLSGAVRITCGPLSDSQVEPVAALLRRRTAAIDGAEVGVEQRVTGAAGSAAFLQLALPDSVSDADASALCALPRVDARPVLQEFAATPSAGATTGVLAAGDAGVFLDDEASAGFELGAVLVDAMSFDPGATAQEVQGTGWMVATTLTADGTALWTTALDACFRRTAVCPTGRLAWLVDDRVVATGQVAAPYAGTPSFVLPGTYSASTAGLLAALIDVTSEGAFGPVAG